MYRNDIGLFVRCNLQRRGARQNRNHDTAHGIAYTLHHTVVATAPVAVIGHCARYRDAARPARGTCYSALHYKTEDHGHEGAKSDPAAEGAMLHLKRIVNFAFFCNHRQRELWKF